MQKQACDTHNAVKSHTLFSLWILWRLYKILPKAPRLVSELDENAVDLKLLNIHDVAFIY
jgi:hypothetical protein